MPNSHSPESDSPNTPAHDAIQPRPGIGRVDIPRPPELFEVDDDVVMDEEDDGTRAVLFEALDYARAARLHLAAMLEILGKCHPAYKIEAGIYLANLTNIQARVMRVVDCLDTLSEVEV